MSLANVRFGTVENELYEVEIWIILLITVMAIIADVIWELRPGRDRWFPDELLESE